MTRLLLDTNAILWLNEQKVSEALVAKVQEAGAAGGLVISAISAWEIASLARRGRLQLSLPVQEFVDEVFAGEGVVAASISPEIARKAGSLEWEVGDPADRLLIATAMAYQATFVTRDRNILEFAQQSQLFDCLEC